MEDPNFLVGSKKSRLQTFSENYGAADDRIFSHPHWYSNGDLPFLVAVISRPDRTKTPTFVADQDTHPCRGADQDIHLRRTDQDTHLRRGADQDIHLRRTDQDTHLRRGVLTEGPTDRDHTLRCARDTHLRGFTALRLRHPQSLSERTKTSTSVAGRKDTHCNASLFPMGGSGTQR